MHRGGATAAVVQCLGPRSVAEVVASPGGKQAVEVLVKDGQPSCVCWCCSFVVGPCQGDGSEVILFGGVDAKAANNLKKCSTPDTHGWRIGLVVTSPLQEYPLSKKGHSHEHRAQNMCELHWQSFGSVCASCRFLRSIAHLRPRSNLIGCAWCTAARTASLYPERRTV